MPDATATPNVIDEIDDGPPLHAGGPGNPPRDPWDFGGGGDGDGGGDDSRDDDPEPVVWITLATFLHPAEAHIARLRLESAGVTCVLLDELTAATHCLSVAVGGVKLQVPQCERERASDLLRRLRHDREPQATIATFATAELAKMAACVVEAAGAACVVRGREVLAEMDELPEAAGALARSPFAAALSPAALAALPHQACPACGRRSGKIDTAAWRRAGRPVRPDLRIGSWPRRLLVPLLAARRCRGCGWRW